MTANSRKPRATKGKGGGDRSLPVPADAHGGSVRPTASYLRDNRSGVINTRSPVLRDHRDEIRAVWRRSAGLALDLIQNSGRLRGAADQVIADTVGSELVLNPQPDLAWAGYDPEQASTWCRTVKAAWKRWAWEPRECDQRGKFTIPQMVDVALRHEMAFGEVTGIVNFIRLEEQRRLGIRTGTKACLVTPTMLVQETNEFEGLYQGVFHDANGRPTYYRFSEVKAGIETKRDYPAFDAAGRRVVMHLFDPIDIRDVRGISRLAPAFRQHIQHEILVDATIQTQILQTIFAATLTTPTPSKEAFEAIEAIDDDDVRSDFLGYFESALSRAADSKISISGDPQVSHLAPGEELKLLTTGTPGPQFLPVSAALSRDMARAIGITYGGLTMDHTAATYSSTRMEYSSIWPVVLRRRERIAAPIYQSIYELWLDEQIGMGTISFKGGYDNFRRYPHLVNWALWQGPAKPSADDLKSSKAATERLQNGTSSLTVECAELGNDPDEIMAQRKREHEAYVKAGLPSPFQRPNSSVGREDSEPDGPPSSRGGRGDDDDNGDGGGRGAVGRAEAMFSELMRRGGTRLF